MNYGVLSPFTSFSGDENTAIEEEGLNNNLEKMPAQFELLGNYPNPFNPNTTIRIQVNANIHEIVFIRIYNALGELVRVLSISVDQPGIYEIFWDGFSSAGNQLSSGSYFYTISFKETVLAGKMTLMK